MTTILEYNIICTIKSEIEVRISLTIENANGKLLSLWSGTVLGVSISKFSSVNIIAISRSFFHLKLVL